MSQWRAYAGNASGFAVGFSRSILLNKSIKAQLQQDDLGDTIDLLKVIYEEEQQVSLCGALIQCARESIDQRVSQCSHDKRRQVLESSNLWLVSALLRMSLFFKHPGFREEEEWRLVVCRSKVEAAEKPTDYPVKTRTTSFGITPYVELPLCESDELLHLEHVVVGPRCEIEGSRSSSTVGLEVLFQELAGGKPKRGIDRSSIPFR